MPGKLRDNVAKLKGLAENQKINGGASEQAIILAIIDILDEIAGFIDAMPESDPAIGGRPGFEGVMASQCPNCGETITINVPDPPGDESIICGSCHEIIGVLSDSILEK